MSTVPTTPLPPNACPNCHGAGQVCRNEMATCNLCSGLGHLDGETCFFCDGSGETLDASCAKCSTCSGCWRSLLTRQTTYSTTRAMPASWWYMLWQWKNQRPGLSA
jgi:hypothetical protein